MAEKIASNVWKIKVDSNIYLIEHDNTYFVIDTGPSLFKQKVLAKIKDIIDPEKVSYVIFTHLHYDHSGNFDLFPNAALLASRSEIACLREDSIGTVLEPNLACRLENAKIKPIDNFDLPFIIIDTPGHTLGSISLFYAKERILFSGDTFFGHDNFGRIDLPTSSPEDMDASIGMIYNLDYEILAPGHDY